MKTCRLPGMAFVAFNVVAGSANAADIPAGPAYKASPMVGGPVYNWTGFYVGLNAGWGWGNNTLLSIGGSPQIINAQRQGGIPSSLSLKPDGFIGGGQVGYNYQVRNWVWGVETDFQGADIKDSTNASIAVPGGQLLTSARENIDFFGTVRGRLGVTPEDRLLIYGTGGLAYAHVRNDANIQGITSSSILVQLPGGGSATRAGWTVGGGIEWAFANSWSLKAEYLYYDLSTRTLTGNAITAPGIVGAESEFASYAFDTKGSVVRAGINYKFDWGSPVVAKH